MFWLFDTNFSIFVGGMDETIRLFAALGYSLFNKGKTSGSRVSFVKDEDVFDMHRPHPGSTVKIGTLKSILKYLNDKGLL